MARTVLLADDSVTAQNMGRRILMDAGYEVITVNNGSAALKKIHESKPDLIVLDVYMPGYGGLEVCQRLKETAETSRIPVLLTVGKMEPFKTDEAKRVRADAHIVKPFDASELLAALTKLEDRIVPQAEPEATGRKKKSESKKARFWHAEDPAKNFDDSNTEQIAYLAEVKKRHAESLAPQETEIEGASGSAQATEIPQTTHASVENTKQSQREQSTDREAAAATFASVIRPMGVPEYIPDTAQEFAVQSEPPAQAETESPEQNLPEAVAVSDQEAQTAELAASPHSEQTTEEVAFIPPSMQDGVEGESPAAVQPSPEVQAAPVEVSTTETPETKPRWIAENVALTAEEAALELEREMRQAQQPASVAEEPAKAAETTESQEGPVPDSAGAEFVSSNTPASTNALAAAASAGGAGADSAVAHESVAELPIPSEAAAAWENWQHIRESVMSPQATGALADSVAEIAQVAAPAVASESTTHSEEMETPGPALSQVHPEPVAAAEAPTQGTSDSSDEQEVLSSIVDTVLAELKPRLMQEIAKKLKSEKK